MFTHELEESQVLQLPPDKARELAIMAAHLAAQSIDQTMLLPEFSKVLTLLSHSSESGATEVRQLLGKIQAEGLMATQAKTAQGRAHGSSASLVPPGAAALTAAAEAIVA